MFRILIFTLCVLHITTIWATALPGGEDVIDATALSYRGAEDAGKVDFPPVGDHTTPVRFTTLKKTDYAWDLGIQAPCTQPIDRDDVLLFTAQIRALGTGSETGDAEVEVVFEQASAPHDKSMIARAGVRPGDGWKTLYFPFHAQQQFAVGEG